MSNSLTRADHRASQALRPNVHRLNETCEIRDQTNQRIPGALYIYMVHFYIFIMLRPQDMSYVVNRAAGPFPRSD